MYFSTSSEKGIVVENCGFFSIGSELSNTREFIYTIHVSNNLC